MGDAQDDGITHFDAANRALMGSGNDAGPKIYDIDQLDRMIGGSDRGNL